MICDFVVDALGNVLWVIQACPDGSYNCPSCGSGVQAHEPHCQNPCCFTRPGYPAEKQHKVMAAEAARKAEAARRVRDHEQCMEQFREAGRARMAHLTEVSEMAKAQGACVSCALHSVRYGGAPKFTKHRGACTRRSYGFF